MTREEINALRGRALLYFDHLFEGSDVRSYGAIIHHNSAKLFVGVGHLPQGSYRVPEDVPIWNGEADLSDLARGVGISSSRLIHAMHYDGEEVLSPFDKDKNNIKDLYLGLTVDPTTRAMLLGAVALVDAYVELEQIVRGEKQ